jgi:hypothetical protein
MNERLDKQFSPRLIIAEGLRSFSSEVANLVGELKQENGDNFDPNECKRHIRFNAAKYDERTGVEPFAGGAYMAHFASIYADSDEDRIKNNRLCEILGETASLLDNAAKMNEDTLFEQVDTNWQRLVAVFAEGSDDSLLQSILWKIFENVLMGALEVNELSTKGVNLQYLEEKDTEEWHKKLENNKRYAVYNRIYVKHGSNLKSISSFESVLRMDKTLSPATRETFLGTLVRERMDRGGEIISTTLERDIEILAFSDNDLSQEYFGTINRFLDHLMSIYEAKKHIQGVSLVIQYLGFIRDHYIPVLVEYCQQMRQAKERQPFAASQFLEAHLVKHQLIAEDREPNSSELFKKWDEARDFHERRTLYGGDKFEFVDQQAEVPEDFAKSPSEPFVPEIRTSTERSAKMVLKKFQKKQTLLLRCLKCPKETEIKKVLFVVCLLLNQNNLQLPLLLQLVSLKLKLTLPP